jgi:hypothetical protein
MQPDSVRAISTKLGANETLLWAGQPRKGIILRRSDVLFVPFSLMWGGFALFWEWNVLTLRAPFFMALWGIPFVLVGLYMMLGRFFLDAMQRGKTYYGITNQRVVILTDLLGAKLRSFPLTNIGEIGMAERSDGSGTITLGSSDPLGMSWFWAGTSWPGANRRYVPTLEMIPDARGVYEIIRQAQQNANVNRSGEPTRPTTFKWD